MNIKILDSWLREYIKTKASAKQISQLLSLSSASVERVEKYKNDFVYGIEVTTNRPDLMSVVGLAAETAAILPQFGIDATFIKPPLKTFRPEGDLEIHIKNNNSLVNRVCAAILEIKMKNSPITIKERLETSGIRSLNNIVDVTNYVMREIGHPVHAFDYDRLTTKTLIIRESKKGETITTLDQKTYQLPGGDIVADNGNGEIVDLLGVMGTLNSIVTHNTKRILLFLDNNEPNHIRKTSMSLGIRSEAAVLNEKGVDPEKALKALLRGIELYCEIADAKLMSKIIDIYPNKPKGKHLTISEEKINRNIGIEIPLQTSFSVLDRLGFNPRKNNKAISVTVPSSRMNDVTIEEDLIEEIARVYGYHNIPSKLPVDEKVTAYSPTISSFFWESRIKQALKYWGFTEVYTYSMVAEYMFEGPIEDAVAIKNPLTDDLVYMRNTLTPSLLHVLYENKANAEIKIFEIANVYIKRENGLPYEFPKLAGVLKKPKINYFEVKGIIEQLLKDLGIEHVSFKKRKAGGLGADIYIKEKQIGEIEFLEANIIDFELNLELLLQHAILTKVYKPLAKYPPIIEDLALIVNEDVSTEELIETLQKQSSLIVHVSLLDQYENTRTFHILYQHPEKNLTTDDVMPIRQKILKVLEGKFNARLKK